VRRSDFGGVLELGQQQTEGNHAAFLVEFLGDRLGSGCARKTISKHPNSRPVRML
jgi:hypothetical protein